MTLHEAIVARLAAMRQPVLLTRRAMARRATFELGRLGRLWRGLVQLYTRASLAERGVIAPAAHNGVHPSWYIAEQLKRLRRKMTALQTVIAGG